MLGVTRAGRHVVPIWRQTAAQYGIPVYDEDPVRAETNILEKLADVSSKDKLETLIARLYDLPIKMIPIEEVALSEIANQDFEPSLQVYAGPFDTSKKVVSLHLKDGRTVYSMI